MNRVFYYERYGSYNRVGKLRGGKENFWQKAPIVRFCQFFYAWETSVSFSRRVVIKMIV